MTERVERWCTVKDRISKVVQLVEGSDPHANSRFGEKIGRSGKVVSEWKNPKRKLKPNRKDLHNIAQAYNLSMDYLLYGVGEPLEISKTEEPGTVYLPSPKQPQQQALDLALLQSDLHRVVETMDRVSRIMERQQDTIEELTGLLKENVTKKLSEDKQQGKPLKKKSALHPQRN